jgi:hypothetical protein
MEPEDLPLFWFTTIGSVFFVLASLFYLLSEVL